MLTLPRLVKGIRGLNLSGGTKTRIALARALYCRAKFVLLDDPWSAVDVMVGNRLLQNLVIDQRLMEGRTLVIVTHHLELLLSSGKVSTIIRMEGGRIKAVEKPGNMAELRTQLETAVQDVTDAEKDAAAVGGNAAQKLQQKKLVETEERQSGNIKRATYLLYAKASSASVWVGVFLFLVLQQCIVIASRYWWVALRCLGSILLLTKDAMADRLLRCLLHSLVIRLAAWGQSDSVDESDEPFTHSLSFEFRTLVAMPIDVLRRASWIPLPPAEYHSAYYLGIYAALSLSAVCLQMLQALVLYLGTVRAAIYLHEKLLSSVLKSPARFFDECVVYREFHLLSSVEKRRLISIDFAIRQPAGRILNRFSSDLDQISGSLGQAVRNVIAVFGSLVSSIGPPSHSVAGEAHLSRGGRVRRQP